MYVLQAIPKPKKGKLLDYHGDDAEIDSHFMFHVLFSLLGAWSMKVCATLFSDVYEGTRMARVTDLSGIRQIIRPLEEAGILIRRTDEEVLTSVSVLYQKCI